MFPSTAKMPKRKASLAQVAGKEPKGRSASLSTKPVPVHVAAKPEKAAGKDKPSDKKVQPKAKRGAKGRQVEVANQELKKIYLQKIEELKMRRALLLRKQERETKSG